MKIMAVALNIIESPHSIAYCLAPKQTNERTNERTKEQTLKVKADTREEPVEVPRSVMNLCTGDALLGFDTNILRGNYK